MVDIAWKPELMLEVKINQEDFLVIKETLSRIGIPSKLKENTLTQTAYILQKKGKYYLVSFKELFFLDNKGTTFTEADLARRNGIASLLESWQLLKICNKNNMGPVNFSKIKVVKYSDKSKWNFISKYTIGKK